MEEYVAKEESKFGEPYQESEVFNVTFDYDEWKENLLSMKDDYFKPHFDEDVEKIAKSVHGYLLGPVGKNGKDVIMPKVRAFKNLEDVQNNIDFSKIYLYYFTLRNKGDGLDFAIRYAEGDVND